VAPVELNGVLGTNVGLLVAWGGLTKPVRDTLRGLRRRQVRVTADQQPAPAAPALAGL
jgi:hypothetical protein